MSKNGTLYLENEEGGNSSTKRNLLTIISDLRSLFKGFVLIANVLPILTGFWLALYYTRSSIVEYWDVFLLTMAGGTLIMAGALTLNNWYEVDLDRVMERTKKRPTVTGNFSMNTVLKIGVSCTILGFIIILFTTVEATVYAFIGWFTYVVLYTFWSKRKYALNTMIGAVSGAVTPLIGWTAIASGYHIVPITLAVIVFFWQMPHTYSIAMRRFDEYKKAKVAMLPVVYGIRITKRQTLLYIACLLPLPFFLSSLGTVFMVIATLLNMGWLILGISGFFTKNDKKWADQIFIYSVNYLTVLFLMMILLTII
jgi:heme o synthase